MNKHIAVTAIAAKKLIAQALAKQLGLDFFDETFSSRLEHYDFLLVFTKNYIGIQSTQEPNQAPFYLNFADSKLQYRLRKATLRNELLARALGCLPRENPYIVDATAGWGTDSYLLNMLGFEVTMLERSPIIYTLLQDGLVRARAERLHIIQTDAIEWLTKQHKKPDVIYLDPMFPEKKKSALVKKEMILLQDLLGADTDSTELFNVAMSCASKRVVVKRPRLAENISNRAPNFSYAGKSSRFDVYLR